MRISDWSSDVCSSDLLKSLRDLNSYTPPITTVWPLSTNTAVVTSRFWICGTCPIDVSMKPDTSSFLIAIARNTRASWVMVGVTLSSSRSEEHTSELQSLMRISYAVFCLKKNNYATQHQNQ